MTAPTDITAYNRRAWDAEVGKGNPWTVPVGPEAIARARQGEVSIVLTPTKTVPSAWLGEINGRDVLCLAASGGQQAPLLAAAGARVTVLDNSPAQLARDRLVAEREGLELHTVEGDMADLGVFYDGAFDLIVHPISNVFVPDPTPVWREAFRVLRPGGALLAGFMLPVAFIFDIDGLERGELVVRHSVPYADPEDLTQPELQRYLDAQIPLEFGHTLDDQIGGQMHAGFHLVGFYEDHMDSPLSDYIANTAATYGVKPAS